VPAGEMENGATCAVNVEFHCGGLSPRIGSIVTRMSLPKRWSMCFYN